MFFMEYSELEKDIEELETYVAQSACIALFLSKGYLLSKNCLREVRASLDGEKPLVRVWEADTARGGAPLHELRDKECPPSVRGYVFDPEALYIQWHRMADFQLVSLKLLAQHLLLASPEYEGGSPDKLRLEMQGQVPLPE